MAYTVTNSKGQRYVLHSRMVTLKGDRKQRIFFFGREEQEGALDELPEGYHVMENHKTGLPMLKKVQHHA